MSPADYFCLLEPYPGKHYTKLWLQQSIHYFDDQTKIVLWLLNDQCLTLMVTIKRKYETLCGSNLNFNNIFFFIECRCITDIKNSITNWLTYHFTYLLPIIMKVHMKKCFMLFLILFIFILANLHNLQSNYL